MSDSSGGEPTSVPNSTSTATVVPMSFGSRLQVIPENDDRCDDSCSSAVQDCSAAHGGGHSDAVERTPRNSDPRDDVTICSLRSLNDQDCHFMKCSRPTEDVDVSPVSTQCDTPVHLRAACNDQQMQMTTTSNVFGKTALVRSVSMQLPAHHASLTGGTPTGTSNDLVWSPSRTNLSAALRRRLSEQVIRTCERQRSESAIHFASWKESKWGEDQFDFEAGDFKTGFDLGVFDTFDFLLVARKLRTFIDQMQIAIWSATRDAVDCPRRQVSDCPKRADRCPKRKRKRARVDVAGTEDSADYTPTPLPTPPMAEGHDAGVVVGADDDDEHLHAAAPNQPKPFSCVQPLTGCVH